MPLELTAATILVAFAGVVPDLLHEGRVRWRLFHRRDSAALVRDGPGHRRRPARALFIAMDLFALRYWKPSTWSKPDLVLLLPGLVVGIGFGYLLFRFLDHRAIAIVMAATTLIFVGLWLVAGAK